MLIAACHCNTVKVEVPDAPSSLTDCNCSLCRRYGVLWAYYKDADVQLVARPGATDEYIWGAKTQKFVRCKTCGCVMQWKRFSTSENTSTGVNARNFEPSALVGVKIRRLDGADTWKYLD